MKKLEATEALNDLYDIIEKCKKRNVQLPNDVINQINEAEENIIRNDILPALSTDIEPRLNTIKRDLVLVVEYHPGEPISVALSRKAKISMITGAKPIIQQPTKIGKPISGGNQNKTQHEPTKKITNHTQGLRVTFPNGTTICNNTAIETFKDVLSQIGLQRIHDLGIIRKDGYNLVDVKMRPLKQGSVWQHKVGKWYIYSNISNKEKIKHLQNISDKLDLNLKIEKGKPQK